MISFFAPGLPKPQGSKNAFHSKSTGKIVVVEQAGRPLKDWRDSVAVAARQAAGTPLEGPIVVSLTFDLPRPKSHGKKTTYPDKRPDIDKLVRAALDAMTKICFTDDGQITVLSAVKRWGSPPGVHVIVVPYLGQGEQPDLGIA